VQRTDILFFEACFQGYLLCFDHCYQNIGATLLRNVFMFEFNLPKCRYYDPDV